MEPINLASSLLGLATLALESSNALNETLLSFHFRPKRVRDLQDEIAALRLALAALTDPATADEDPSTTLILPLLRCGNACKDFNQAIVRCSLRSGIDRAGFRDWAEVKYMHDDIDGFRRLLACYKSTIHIALTDLNL